MKHTEVKIGERYIHILDGKLWQVTVTSLFEDRCRWCWEGLVTENNSREVPVGAPCWGYVSELQQPASLQVKL